MRIITWLICVVSIAACQSGGGPVGGSPADLLHELELKREVRIPSKAARAFFQHGEQIASKDRYESYCELEISTVAEQPQRVAPDTFAITRVARRLVSDEESGMPVQIGIFGSQDVFHETHLWLSSERQPGVRKLICRSWTQDLGRGRFLSVSEMQEVLGSGFVLR